MKVTQLSYLPRIALTHGGNERPDRRKTARPIDQGFLRELAGGIAMRITGAKKGQGQGGFWGKLAWSRVVNWGRDFRGASALSDQKYF